MAVVKVKPTSPGRRGMVKVVHKHLHKGKPEASLLEPQMQNAGRNNNGHITIRHKGGGHKHHYRVVDFVRNKDAIPAKVERIEYDPNRTAHIALVCYADGERRYIIAPRGLEVGATVLSGAEAPIKAGNTLPIRNIPVGSIIHCVEMMPGKGAQIARSDGCPSNDALPPCHTGASCAPRLTLRRWWRGNRCGSYAPHRSANELARRFLRAPAA